MLPELRDIFTIIEHIRLESSFKVSSRHARLFIKRLEKIEHLKFKKIYLNRLMFIYRKHLICSDIGEIADIIESAVVVSDVEDTEVLFFNEIAI